MKNVFEGEIKMNESFENNEFFQQLPEETKEKIRNCKTEEEAMEILKGDMIPIPDDFLEVVAGGAIYDDRSESDLKCPAKDNCKEFHTKLSERWRYK